MNSPKLIPGKNVLGILGTISIFLLLALYQNAISKYTLMLRSNDVKNSTPVRILLWTAPVTKPSSSQMYRLNNFIEIMNGQQGQENCEETCEFTLDRKYLNESSAIVYFLFTIGLTLADLPKERNDSQLWVMFAHEPPPFAYWRDPLKNQFNWSMSYRMDSDVWIPYGKTVARKIVQENISIQNLSVKSWIAQKSKLATAVVSRCTTDSQRELLIKQINNSVIIDVYGQCGKMPSCGTMYSKTCGNFWTELSSDYKFYLAFENSVCQDYITEKFWRSLELGFVPVVYGGGNYLKEAPPGSFVDVQDFQSAEQLAQFLKRVGDAEKEYAKYFEWHKKYRILSFDESNIQDWCSLCKAVRRHKFEGHKKVYNDAKLWWESSPPANNSSKPACLKGRDFFAKANLKAKHG